MPIHKSNLSDLSRHGSELTIREIEPPFHQIESKISRSPAVFHAIVRTVFVADPQDPT